jgi:hypothetical protein
VLASAEMTCTAVRATKARRAKARAEARHGSRPALGVLEAGFQRPNKTVMRNWTEGPFDTEAKARESLQWQFAVPFIEASKKASDGELRRGQRGEYWRHSE